MAGKGYKSQKDIILEKLKETGSARHSGATYEDGVRKYDLFRSEVLGNWRRAPVWYTDYRTDIIFWRKYWDDATFPIPRDQCPTELDAIDAIEEAVLKRHTQKTRRLL
ncbi:hypothetical protein G7Y89_g5192 [Cudoniella acicularis]|uniref:Uncharacterized protein n=1 Tax=Cudoniella acicularis TaxID=354080 RepID=A0A8H4RR37_9HELO|nr:hypothetical protein G7Y89_g5192 [Cudoniella acicularis]